MTSAPFGTLSWARANDGRMTRGEQLRELARATGVLLRTAPAQVLMRLGYDSPRAFAFDPERIPIPDSAIACDAEEECRTTSDTWLLNHCRRTYLWGMLLAERDGLRPDPELLYVAALLHDLALTDTHRHAHPMPCFAARGGLLAVDWAGARGWQADRCATLGDAISLHLNAVVDPAHGPEAQLLQAGAGIDVIGLRAWELGPSTVAAVLTRHPRLDQAERLAVFEREAHPATRAGLLLRAMMFGTFMRHVPFDRR